MRWEGAGLKHNARCGLVAGMKVIGQVFLPRETFHCPLYSEKEGWCRVETIYLIGIGLKTKVFGVYYARLESPNISINISFHSEGLKPTAHYLTKECQEKHKERSELLPMKKL